MSEGIEIQTGCLVYKRGVTHNGQDYDVVVTVRDVKGKPVSLDGLNDAQTLETLAAYVNTVARPCINLVSSSDDLSRWGWIYDPTSQTAYSIEAPKEGNAANVIEAAQGNYNSFVQKTCNSSQLFREWAHLHEFLSTNRCVIAQRYVSSTPLERIEKYKKTVEEPLLNFTSDEYESPEGKQRLKVFFQEAETFWKDHVDEKERYRLEILEEEGPFPQYVDQLETPSLSLEELWHESLFRRLYPDTMVDEDQLASYYQEIMSS